MVCKRLKSLTVRPIKNCSCIVGSVLNANKTSLYYATVTRNQRTKLKTKLVLQTIDTSMDAIGTQARKQQIYPQNDCLV